MDVWMEIFQNERQGFKAVSLSEAAGDVFSPSAETHTQKKERKMDRKEMKVIRVGFLPFFGKWL